MSGFLRFAASGTMVSPRASSPASIPAVIEEPLIVNVLDHLRAAGAPGLRASRLFDLLNMVRPRPPPFVTLQQLVEDGLVASDAPIVSIDSLLRLTAKGSEALDAAIAAGVWQCRINAGTKDTLAPEPPSAVADAPVH